MSGLHVVRSEDPGTFAVLRCGDVRTRFSQIDMLHLDVWWRGVNVLADGGSFAYNLREWNEHFMRTAAHNTIGVDDADQMLHHRPFKCLFWTRANFHERRVAGSATLLRGEHLGYERLEPPVRHQRSLLTVGELVVVVDAIVGEGQHEARLHWLGGVAGHEYDARRACLRLRTDRGDYSIQTLTEAGALLPGDVVAGQAYPPRGWLSRYHGFRQAVPSLAVVRRGRTPLTFVTVLGGRLPAIHVDQSGVWDVRDDTAALSFAVRGGWIRLADGSHTP